MVLSLERWVGKVAVVTGASSGIGVAIAEQLVDKGIHVAALARRKDRLDDLAKKLVGRKGKLHPVQSDISKEEDVLNAFKWIKENLGPVHILINNAGVTTRANLIDGNTEDWQNVIQVNVIGLSIATREAIKDMRANNVDGHIIHINSLLGHQVIRVGMNMYPPSKFAVTALAETLRLELNSLKSKIKITSLSPGVTDTDFIPDAVRKKERQEDGTIIEPEQIADGVVYVLSTPPHVQISHGKPNSRNGAFFGSVGWQSGGITGASSGIGAAIAKQLVEKGIQVAALARRKDRLEELAKKLAGKKGKLHPVQTDISKEEDIVTAFKWIKENLGPIHILINNAGVVRRAFLIDGNTEDWKTVIQVNGT